MNLPNLSLHRLHKTFPFAKFIVRTPEDMPDKIMVSRGGDGVRYYALPESGINLRDAVEEFENNLIVQALQKAQGVKNRAAQLLSLNRTTLVEKLKKKKLDYHINA